MAIGSTPPGTSASSETVDVAGQIVGTLLDAHRQQAFNLAYRLVRSPEDAADVVHDAYVLAMRATRRDGATLRDPGRLAPWLLKIVANVALGQLRRRRRGTSIPLDDLSAELAAGESDEPLAAIVRREQRGDVLRALLALPDSQRAALTLREYQGLSYAEIGKRLGLDIGATAALLYRSRAAFRAAYQGVAVQGQQTCCPALTPLISAMLDQELVPEVWRQVDLHLAACRRCRRELRQPRRTRRLYRLVPLLARRLAGRPSSSLRPATPLAPCRLPA